MKKIRFKIFAGLFSAIIAISYVSGQTSVNLDINAVQKRTIEIVREQNWIKEHLNSLENINPKALKDFAKRYKNVSSESWAEMQDGFFAKFTENSVKNIVYYDKNGKWFGYIKSYDASQLSGTIRSAIESKYCGYDITYVEEMETVGSDGLATYLIHLENKKFVKLIRFYEGRTQVWDEIRKI